MAPYIHVSQAEVPLRTCSRSKIHINRSCACSLMTFISLACILCIAGISCYVREILLSTSSTPLHAFFINMNRSIMFGIMGILSVIWGLSISAVLCREGLICHDSVSLCMISDVDFPISGDCVEFCHILVYLIHS